jgi:hypothetical protein
MGHCESARPPEPSDSPGPDGPLGDGVDSFITTNGKNAFDIMITKKNKLPTFEFKFLPPIGIYLNTPLPPRLKGIN